MASAAIHGLLLAAWLNYEPAMQHAGSDDVIVELVSLDAEPVAEKAQPIQPAAPKKPDPVVQQVTEKKERVTPPKIRQVMQVARAIDAPASAPAARPAQSASKQEQAAEPAAVPVAQTNPEPEPAQAQTAADTARVRQLVRNHLESFKFYPASARRRSIEGHVEVAFRLAKNGAASGVTVLQGSGYAVLDHAAMETVNRAQPFPIDNGQYRFRLKFKRL